MAAGDRTKRIRQRVLDRIAFASGLGRISHEKIHRTMDDVQREISEALLCLEGKWEIVVSNTDELVAFPPNFVAEKQLTPRSGSQPLERIDLAKRDVLKREYNAVQNGDSAITNENSDVFYYYQWNDNFGFLLQNGQVPSSDIEIDCYYWHTPDPTADKVSDSKDPILHRRFDRLIEYMTLSEITGRPEDEQRWEREMSRMEERVNTTNIDVGSVPTTRDYD